MYYVYALLSSDKKRIYVGLTGNIEERLKEHNRGKTKSTKHYGPWVLLYSEECPNRLKARIREKQLKSGQGREFLKNLANCYI